MPTTLTEFLSALLIAFLMGWELRDICDNDIPEWIRRRAVRKREKYEREESFKRELKQIRGKAKS